MPDPDQLNRLSCTRCKDRKVRCNRVMPICSRCKAHAAQCIYPQRAKRRTARALADDSMSANTEALATILDRLQRLEARSTGGGPPSTSGAVQQATNSPSHCPSPAETNLSGYLDSYDASRRVDLDATTILRNAVDRARNLMMRDLSTSVITDAIEIPAELAKRWLRNYFDNMPTWLFHSLIDKRTLQLIPDIIGVPHIHVDPAILVIYYCILYHGCTLRASNDSSTASVSYARPNYLACLRAIPGWQRQATGTMMDLIAALFLTRVSYQFFDEELSWKMFRHACEYCQILNLHQLDNADTTWGEGDDKVDCDADRKGSWEVLQIDLYYRLVMDKPPIFSVNAWRVNLPWLDPNSQPPPETIQASAFLATSRITLIVIRFFALLEDPENDTKAEVMVKTEELCQEIIHILEEWGLSSWIERNPDRDAEVWEIADVPLTGYTCIIYMFRKMTILDSNSPEPFTKDVEIPETPVVMEACRRIIDLMCQLLVMVPYVQTVVTTLGAYRCYIAFAYIANTILRSSNIQQHLDDIKSLKRLGDQAELVCKGQKDMSPIIHAMQRLNTEISNRYNQLASL